MTGATDAYHYSQFCPRVYRFGPLLATPEETACVHAANERVSVQALSDALEQETGTAPALILYGPLAPGTKA